MNRKEFIQSHGATCRNWMWSWSFVNEEKKIVIFGEWDVYERSRLHVTVSARYRDLISEVTPLNGTKLNDARKIGHEQHSKEFRWSSGIRAYAMWSGLHLVLAVMGIFVCFVR